MNLNRPALLLNRFVNLNRMMKKDLMLKILQNQMLNIVSNLTYTDEKLEIGQHYKMTQT